MPPVRLGVGARLASHLRAERGSRLALARRRRLRKGGGVQGRVGSGSVRTRSSADRRDPRKGAVSNLRAKRRARTRPRARSRGRATEGRRREGAYRRFLPGRAHGARGTSSGSEGHPRASGCACDRLRRRVKTEKRSCRGLHGARDRIVSELSGSHVISSRTARWRLPRLRRVPGSRRGGPLRARARARRAARAAPVRASGATYDEVFDGATGQMIQTLSQSTETVSAGGLEWSYRLGVPEEGVEAQPHKVVLVHGAGLLAFTYSKLMRELQTQGYVCVAPDMPATAPPASLRPRASRTTCQRTRTRFRNFWTRWRSGRRAIRRSTWSFPGSSPAKPRFCSPPRTRIACAACACSTRRSGTATSSRPARGVGRPFGMGKGANADVYKLAYFGNEFAIDPERMGVYEAPYVGPDAAAARDAFEATGDGDVAERRDERRDRGAFEGRPRRAEGARRVGQRGQVPR